MFDNEIELNALKAYHNDPESESDSSDTLGSDT